MDVNTSDPSFTNDVDCEARFPDFATDMTMGTGIVAGKDLKPGTSHIDIKRKITCMKEDDVIEFTLFITYTAD